MSRRDHRGCHRLGNEVDADGVDDPGEDQVADRDPIDATSEDAGLTLLSYVWPGQEQRFVLLRAALACHTGMATFSEAGVSDKPRE